MPKGKKKSIVATPQPKGRKKAGNYGKVPLSDISLATLTNLEASMIAQLDPQSSQSDTQPLEQILSSLARIERSNSKLAARVEALERAPACHSTPQATPGPTLPVQTLPGPSSDTNLAQPTGQAAYPS